VNCCLTDGQQCKQSSLILQGVTSETLTKNLSEKNKVLLSPNPSFVYEELVRLGMPTGEGYSEKYFAACYKK
jgi:hypothetical protein